MSAYYNEIDPSLIGPHPMTPVDIEKLKELCEQAGDCRMIADTHHTKDYAGREHGFLRAAGEFVPVAGFVLGVEGMPQDQGRARLALAAAAMNALPALIAKAERVDALERALERAAIDLEAHAWQIPGSLEAARAARNALSPKPEISDPTKRMEKILGATFTRKATP